MTIAKKGGYTGGRPTAEMGPPAATPADIERLVGPSPLHPPREHVTTDEGCWCGPTTEKVAPPAWTPFLSAMGRVEGRRGLVADVDLPAEYAKAALTVTAELVSDLDYARADARHWHQGWEAATRDVERQGRWLREATARAETAERQRDLALLREGAAKEDAATHAEREGAAEGRLRQWESLRQTIVDLGAMALFHAQHDGVDPKDRQRILDLVVQISNALPSASDSVDG